ncbi:SPOR domain-containing protein, partial [Caulobacter sp. 17J65-9]|nr:SPOR domain-containing protein [Caulobacter sp. 17J65-9]
MSDQERGAYTPPTDEPLAFDARRTTGERRPVPMTLVASAVVLVVLVVAVVLFYRSGVRSRNEAPNVGEPVAAVKTAPAQDAQPVDEAASLDVYVAEPNAPAPAQPTFAPGPEQPAPRPAPSAPVAVA